MPFPDNNMDNTTTPAPKRSATAWGHDKNPDKPRELIANREAMALLNQAFEYLDKDCSFREVAAWLSAASGRPISHVVLHKKYQSSLESLSGKGLSRVNRL